MSDNPIHPQDASPKPAQSGPITSDPQSIEGLFIAALAKQAGSERDEFLNVSCGDDVDRRRRVDALLLAYEDAGSFLENPPLASGTPQTLSLHFLTPSSDPGLLGMLGPYEVVELLGRGGMGIVFRARDPKLNRIVAIKVLVPELAVHPSARLRFLREARAAAAINHPHVVTIHAVEEGATTLPFLVMECIVGQTLQQKLDKQGALRLTEALRIGHQLACGLAAAHKQGLIHRDIKPANVLLENGVERVKITDFGLARAVDDSSISRTGDVSGTPQYMSPEQASGEKVDHRSDLFSLGCVMYAMCTGRSPFRATSLAGAIKRVCQDTPRPIEEINPECPTWLIEIVNHLLEKDPDHRPQTADEVAALLADHLAAVQQPTRARGEIASRHRPAARTPLASAPADRTAQAPVQLPAIPVRALCWVGSLLLLVPLVIGLAGFSFSQGDHAFERAVVAAVICIPMAVAIFAFALFDRRFERHAVANALFLICCIVLGPIGILLYLLRRDRWEAESAAQGVFTPERGATSGLPPRSEDAEAAAMPRSLVSPLPGPAGIFAGLGYAVAALLMGQAIEQWSDYSAEVGVSLFVASIVLGTLSLLGLHACGLRSTFGHWLIAGLSAIPLVYLGAQAPGREYTHGLASEADMVAIFASVLTVLCVPLMVLLLNAVQPSDGDNARRVHWTSREDYGNFLTFTGIAIWVGLAVWMGGIAANLFRPPAGDPQALSIPLFAIFMLGGLLFGTGMILCRRVLTPGLVRKLATESDARRVSHGSTGSAVEPSGNWSLHDWARLVFQTGLVVLVLPWLPILYGFVADDGDPMEFGGRLVLPATVVAALAFIGAWITKLVASSIDARGGVVLAATGTRDERVHSRHGVSPWRALGWLLVAGLVLIPTSIAVMLIVPQLTKVEMGTVVVEFDSHRPVTRIIAKGGIGAAHAKQIERTEYVTRNPYQFPLPPGIYDLTMTYQTDAISGTFTQRAEVQSGRTVTLDVRQSIAVAHQLQHLDPGSGRVPKAPVPSIRLQILGDTSIGRIELDGEDVDFAVSNDGEVQIPTSVGHHNVMVVLQSGERYHYGVDVAEERIATLQLPPGATGLLRLDIADPLLSIRLRPRGSGGAAAEPVTLTPVNDGLAALIQSPQTVVGESGRFRVPAGRYDVWVTDQLAGWCREGSREPVEYSSNEVEIAAGSSHSLTVHRNLKLLPDLFGGWSDHRLYDFRWNGSTYTLTRPQAQIVHQLFSSYADDEPTVSARELMANVNPLPEFPALEEEENCLPYVTAIFDDGAHPAWGTLLISDEQAESLRLSDLRVPESPASSDNAQLNITFEDAGLRLILERRDKYVADTGPIETSSTLTLEPGTYVAFLEDDLAGWHSRNEYGEPGQVRYEYWTLGLTSDRATDLNVTRNFYRMAAGFPPLHTSGPHYFRWLGETFTLSGLQATAVAILLKAYAEQTGDVHEAVLMQGANFQGRRIILPEMTAAKADELLQKWHAEGKSLQSVFDDGQHPAWGTLIIPGEREAMYRLAPLPNHSGAEPLMRAEPPPSDLVPLEPGPSDPAGFLTIDIRDDGMLVAFRLRQKSAFGGFIISREQQTKQVGQTTFRLTPGEYQVRIIDQQFGWADEYGARSHVLDVAAGSGESIVVRRDFGQMAYAGEVEGLSFIWEGQRFRPFDPEQIGVINRLLKAYAEGHPEVSEQSLVSTFNEAMRESLKGTSIESTWVDRTSLAEVFDEVSGWDQFIVRGQADRTYRLKHVPRGTLVIEFQDDLLTAEVREPSGDRLTARRTARSTPQMVPSLDSRHEWQLPPGEYVIDMTDHRVGWSRHYRQTGAFPGETLLTQSRLIAVSDGETTTAPMRRDFEFLASFSREGHGIGPEDEVLFTWDTNAVGTPFRQLAQFPVDVRQEKCVRALLRAFAAGESELLEEEVLKRAGVDADSLLSVFDDLEEEDGLWSNLLVRGEQAGTWRLKPLPDPPRHDSERVEEAPASDSATD